MKRRLNRNVIAIAVTIALSCATAFLGWMSAFGIAMVFAFLLFTPVVALIAIKRELQFSLFYVMLSWAIYLLGLLHWGMMVRDSLADTWRLVYGLAEDFGTDLFCSALTTLPVYLWRRYL